MFICRTRLMAGSIQARAVVVVVAEEEVEVDAAARCSAMRCERRGWAQWLSCSQQRKRCSVLAARLWLLAPRWSRARSVAPGQRGVLDAVWGGSGSRAVAGGERRAGLLVVVASIFAKGG